MHEGQDQIHTMSIVESSIIQDQNSQLHRRHNLELTEFVCWFP